MNNTTSSWRSIIIKTAIVSTLIIGAMSLYGHYYGGSNYGNHMTMEEIEGTTPEKFLKLEGNYNKSFWGTEYKIKGKIINSAQFASFKDIVVVVNYHSKTETVIHTKKYTIYEVYPPNSTTEFTLDVDNYKDVKSISCNIGGALPNTL